MPSDPDYVEIRSFSQSEMFRPEAVRFATNRLQGSLVIHHRPSHLLLALFATVIVLAGFAAAAVIPIPQKVEAPGWIVPAGGLVRMAAPQTGILSQLNIAENRPVRKGELLAILRYPTSSAAGETEDVLEETARRQLEALADQTAVNIEKASAEVGDAERRLRLLQRELLEANGRARIEYDKLVLARSRLEGYSTLAARGLISRAALVQHHTNVLEAEAAVSQARSSVLGIEREIANAEAEARASRLNGRLAASEGQAGRAALVERLTTASRQQGSRIYASSDGTVGAVPVSLGQTVAGGETIAWLMPNQGRLEVEIYVAAANAAQVRVGQEVRVHFQDERNSSLSLTGRVRAVTMNALPPNEIALPSANLEEPVFVTRVALPTDFGGHNLRAGTPVRATILVRRQTLLARILQPPSAAGRQ